LEKSKLSSSPLKEWVDEAVILSGFVKIDGKWKPPIPDTINRRRRRTNLPDFLDPAEQIRWLLPRFTRQWKIQIISEPVLANADEPAWTAIAIGPTRLLCNGYTMGEATLKMFVAVLGYEKLDSLAKRSSYGQTDRINPAGITDPEGQTQGS